MKSSEPSLTERFRVGRLELRSVWLTTVSNRFHGLTANGKGNPLPQRPGLNMSGSFYMPWLGRSRGVGVQSSMVELSVDGFRL